MKLHFIGIGGSGISGVAKLAEEMGHEVTGCDLEGSTAYKKEIFQGHSPEHIKDVDLVIATPAIFYQDKDNTEILAAKEKGILITWEEFVGKYLAKDKKVICVAGTHGKSTTTAMVGRLLEEAGLDPLVVIGAKVPDWDGNSRFGKGEYFVIEADEFNNNFLSYHPKIIILNNIEFDHPDFFKSEEEVFESFEKFIKNITGEKILICNSDSVGVEKLLKDLSVQDLKIIKYSAQKKDLDFKLKVPGTHNQLNALGVIALGRELGIKDDVIKSSLESFTGISRRMELISDKSGIIVYDDYAHHPTAIAATITGIREKYPDSRIWAIDEPHGFARTKALLSNYNGVFDGADKVLIGPIFKARDVNDPDITPELVAEKSEHKDARGVNSFEEIKDILKKELKPEDVVLVMGAGKSYKWAREIAEI
jgi:UDP-N-acetylmuramate--alanine ligase